MRSTHEPAAAELAVGEDVEAQLALALEDAQDRAVLERAQLVRRRAVMTCREQLGGSEKAADVVGAIRGHAAPVY